MEYDGVKEYLSEYAKTLYNDAIATYTSSNKKTDIYKDIAAQIADAVKIMVDSIESNNALFDTRRTYAITSNLIEKFSPPVMRGRSNARGFNED